jgi:hypothetical protein
MLLLWWSRSFAENFAETPATLGVVKTFLFLFIFFGNFWKFLVFSGGWGV